MIEAFFLASGKERVFATYHPPADASSRVLAVLCPPFFSDYMRTQLALRRLATSLSEQGQHVVRFDYRGTGDSEGELADFSIIDWISDIAAVIREGQELTGCSVIRLLGVRASALLACEAAKARKDIQRVVLWDPVADGENYIQLLQCLQSDLLARNIYLSRAERLAATGEYGGYALSIRMLDELRSLDARVYGELNKDSLCVLTSSPDFSFPVYGVKNHVTPFNCNWNRVTEDLLMPLPILEQLGKCLK